MKTQTHIIIDGDAISIRPSAEHRFLIEGVELARFYKMQPAALAAVIKENSDELIKNRHFVEDADGGITWTACGVVMLGFFVPSRYARDFAQEVLVQHLGNRSPFDLIK